MLTDDYDLENLFLLKEYIDRNEIIDAISSRESLYIYYDSPSDTTILRGWRTIEPYLIGINNFGNLVVRSWQTAGISDSAEGLKGPVRPFKDEVPGWRLFRLEGIQRALPTGRSFKNQIPRPKYNKDDKDMSKIILAIDPLAKEPIKAKGIDSITQANITSLPIDSTKGGIEKFGMSKDKFEQFKRQLRNITNVIRKYKKRKLSDYHLVYNPDRKQYIPMTQNAYNKLTDEQKMKFEVGNIEDLYNTYIQTADITNKKNRFFDRQREKLKKGK